MAAYDSVDSLEKAIDEIKNLFSVRDEEISKCIHDHAASLALVLKTIRLLTEKHYEMYELNDESDEWISMSVELDIIEAFLRDSQRLHCQDSEPIIESLERQVSELAIKANESIQIFVGFGCGSIKSSGGRWSRFKFKRRMRKVAEEMNWVVRARAMMIKDEFSTIAANSSLTFAPDDKLVGFDNDLLSIKEWLLSGSIKLFILPIFGSGGTGKTTLARYLYNDPDIIKHFTVRVWVTVSQNSSRTHLLRSLLLSLGEQNEALFQESRQMQLMVNQCLYKKRYLIVIDDVCSGRLWDYAQMLFHDDHKGSRVLLTTRQYYFAALSSSHHMNLMNEDESWYLLSYKVFGEQGCPLEFEPVGRKIARGCEGLRLSIVTMADLLSSIPMTLDSWEVISEDVISAIYTKDSQLEDIMNSSFDQLPHHLRQCLLYMAGFPKNHELGVSELIKLWVAEGFIKPKGSKTFEEVAEEYVEVLVRRSLVMVVSRSKDDGRIKSYSLQNLVRHLCMRKIQERKFLLPVMDYLSHTTLRRYFLPKCLKNQRRVILSSYDLLRKEAINDSPVRTIICIQQGEYLPTASVQKFPQLRILHVVNKSDNLGWDSDQVFELIHLRYLASNILSSSIPATISKLRNLQTLIIYRYDVRLPEEIWRLTKLRHLIAFSFNSLPHPQLTTSPLQSLQTLSLVSNLVISEIILKMIPNLKKFAVYYSDDTSEQDYQLNNLAKLHELQNLKLEVHKNFCFRWELNQVIPVTLMKLSLSGCRLPWKDMTILGSLPNLEVLKLRKFAFQGDFWETNREEFPELKYLLIDESDLLWWGWNSGLPHPFPRLVCLMLYHCPYLQSIPDEFEHIWELELLEVDGRNESLVKSAMELQEIHERWGNKSFRVEVKYS